MRLKNLNIKGFKSFADETIIHFNESVTGIVGPNGSGKSNIVDAIRWVLGEQKGRELRLEQMSDVIFNGTKKRKEAPLAQVSLNFENTKNLLPTEYHNIEIARLLYRSGDSEYRLNGVTCRLKDITSLFLDTGIGSDSYAIIALNMVEDLLSNKESARRKMFEQAAGISKYKARKRETLNKLKTTKEDLARIEDLLFEINNNLLELEKQAKRTKKYNELKEKYKSAGLLVQFLSVKTLKEKLAGLESTIEEEILKITQEESSMSVIEAQIESNKKMHLDQEKSLSDFQKRVNEILDTIRTLESSIQIDEQKKNFQSNQLEILDQNILQAKNKIDLLNSDIAMIRTDLAQTQLDFKIAEEEVLLQESFFSAKQAEFNLLKSGVDQFQLDKQKNESLIFDLEKEMAIQQNQLENLKSDSSRCEDEIAGKLEEYHQVNHQNEAFKLKLVDIQKDVQTVLVEEETRLASLKNVQLELEEVTNKVSSIYRQRDAKKNEFDLLKSMVEKMEGFPESIKFLNQNWRQDVPVLSDLIYTEEKYRSAIELYLEHYLNFYVAYNEDDAVKAIRLLFNNSKGKANFFILDKFRNPRPTFKEIEGCIPALSVVEVSEAYQPLMNDLLKDVYILENDQHLEDVIRFPDDISIISVSGSIVKANRVITGGSVGLFEGKKLGRKKNLEKLETEIQKLESQSIQHEKQLSEIKNQIRLFELNDRQKDLDGYRRKESEILQQMAQLQAKLQHYLDLKSDLGIRIAENQEKAYQLTNRLQSNHISITDLKATQLQLMQSLHSSDEDYNRVSIELSDVTNIFNQAKLELLKWQNKYENIQKDLVYKENQLNDILKQTNEDQLNKIELTKSIAELSIAIDIHQTELIEKLDFRKNMDSNLSTMETDYYEMRNLISEAEVKAKFHQKAIFELQSVVNQIKDQKAEFKFKIQSAYEKAQIEFLCNLDEFIASEEDLELDLEALQEKSQYYKTRIDNYGEVNPLALEAYEEMKGRLDKITEQRDDILKAQDSLMETIKEIEETATSGFLQAFNQIRVHFQTVFRSLFTDDDDCDLVLVDDSDPLECDIDIIAKPKGKRPKSISQLSGGEKTLTAIALLFSLYLLKPAPFCIFDEVDAPLDDINIEKFNRIIRKFSKESQFIIITHNKLTMADVDVLYGVYMEDQGVSSVTAVDFRKYDHEVELEEMAN
ncbi:MAG: chromosome segregation protein SMC [Saprospiraceae bacterium]|nr:chromosome segregation protein SMC [Saprospiraceae bacterium]